MKITWRSPSNIALIKYWGKHDLQLPNNPSLSITLSEAFTETSVEFKPFSPSTKKKKSKTISLHFLFEGKKNESFEAKILTYLESIGNSFPFLYEGKLVIKSSNSFPHSAGIASSASSMAALALCIATIDIRLLKKKISFDEFISKASNFARIGSGSASRSLYPEFAVWGKAKGIKHSSDEVAIQYPTKYHSDFNEIQDTILIVNDGEKNVSSRAGHALMENHPLAMQRYENANKHLADLLIALNKGDWNLFCTTVEAEALELHALMMTSNPSFILMKPNTLAIIERIRQFRVDTKIPICFTLDAGPNVHLIYPYFEKKKIRNFIQTELLQFCVKKKVIFDFMGRGPQQIFDGE